MNKVVFSKCAVIATSASLGLLTVGTTSTSAFSILTEQSLWEAESSGKALTTKISDNRINHNRIITFDDEMIFPAQEESDNSDINAVGEGSYNGIFDATQDDTKNNLSEITWAFPQRVFAFSGDFGAASDQEILQIFGNFRVPDEKVVNLGDRLSVTGDRFSVIIDQTELNSIAFSTPRDTDTFSSQTQEVFSMENFSNAVFSLLFTIIVSSAVLGLVFVTTPLKYLHFGVNNVHSRKQNLGRLQGRRK